MADRKTSPWRSALVAFVAAMVSICAGRSMAATTTYTGVYAGGTIAPGDEVVVTDTGRVAGPIVTDGSLVFDQSSDLAVPYSVSGTGAVAKLGSGTLTVGSTASSVSVGYKMRVANGALVVGNSGSASLWIYGSGNVSLETGRISNGTTYVSGDGSTAGLVVSGGTWSHKRNLWVQQTGAALIEGGYVSANQISVYSGGDRGVIVRGGTLSATSLVVSATDQGRIVIDGGCLTTGTAGLCPYNYNESALVDVRSGTFIVNQRLSIAESGTGVLQVSGGTAFIPNTTIGGGFFTSGAVDVRSGSLIASGNINVGNVNGGKGSMTVRSGAVAIVGGTLTCSASGSVQIDPGGTLRIGAGGTTGDLRSSINNNGQVVFDRRGHVSCPAMTGTGAVVVRGGAFMTSIANISGTSYFNRTFEFSDATIGIAGANMDYVVGAGTSGRLAITRGSMSCRNLSVGRNQVGWMGSGAVALTSSTLSVTGTLQVGCSDSYTFGSGSMSIDSGSIDAAFAAVSSYSNQASILRIAGGNALIRNQLVVGSGGYGSLIIDGGTLTVGGTLSIDFFGTLALNRGGVLRVGDGGATGSLVSPYFVSQYITNHGTLVFNRTSDYEYAGRISGDGSIEKEGRGMLTLSRPSTLTGPTIIRQGAVQLTHASALSASTISPMGGGVLSLSPNLQAMVGGLNPNTGGLIDVNTGMITVAKGLSATDLVAALQSGRAGGSWTGSSGDLPP